MAQPEISGGAFYAKPTWRERLKNWLGFGWQSSLALMDWRCQEPELGFAPGAMITETHIQLDWGDRLRLLLTGHCAIEVSTKTDVIVSKALSRSRFAVLTGRAGPPR